MKLLGIILIGYGLILCFIEKFAWYRILWFLAGTGLILATASRIALPFWAEVLAYLPTVLILILIVWIHSNNEKAAQNKDNNPAESIIVLGCKVGSLSFENRTREAVNYLLDHPEKLESMKTAMKCTMAPMARFCTKLRTVRGIQYILMMTVTS